MSQLSWMITITDRKKAPDFVALYQQQNIHVSLTTVGAGTAVSETLNYLGLERTEKAVIFTTVTDSRWKAVKRQLEHTMNIDVPGTGIAFTIPVSSIGGKRAPILGRVCMDQFMVDVTEIPGVQVGTPVTLVGTDGNETLSMEEVSGLAHSFNYELPCRIARRVPRVYYRDGVPVDAVEYIPV